MRDWEEAMIELFKQIKEFAEQSVKKFDSIDRRLKKLEERDEKLNKILRKDPDCEIEVQTAKFLREWE